MAALAAPSSSDSALVGNTTLNHIVISPVSASAKISSALSAMPSWPSPNPPGSNRSVGYPH